ncbi:MAG: Rieske 2Fe-2S domain-containing protein [Myxococcales bacterium]|nr:Rieske 2Fe-2S domain-containing protein [Myxococcales bacterium]
MLPRPPATDEPLVWISLGPADDYPVDEPLPIRLDRDEGRLDLTLVRQGDEFHVLGGLCPHRGAPLAELGFLDGEGHLVCGWHYWSFRLTDGGHSLLDSISIGRWPTRVVEGDLQVGVPA